MVAVRTSIWSQISRSEVHGLARVVAFLVLALYRASVIVLDRTGLSRVLARIGIALKSVFGPILRRFAGPIMVGGLIASGLLIWLCALLFRKVDQALTAVPATERHVTVHDFAVGLKAVNMLWFDALPYLLYPLTLWWFRDILLTILIVFVLGGAIPFFAIWWERKIAGRIQSRLGPMRVGGWHGWAQSAADGIKLIAKEDLIPEGADKPLFLLAPYLAIVPSMLAFVALPFGLTWIFRDLDVGLVFILAMLGVEVVGVILAGWASNNKWSVYGAMREACQMVSYEIPMGMALLVPIMVAGTLSMRTIGEMQAGGWTTWLVFHNPLVFAAALVYFVASLASCKRAPFDLPESESELVAGFHTEYSGFRWSLFFFAEYAAMFVVGAILVILFFGAWNSPFPQLTINHWTFNWLAGPFWLIAKALAVVYVQLWIRWTLPRIRIDQVLYCCVQVILPLTMVLVMLNALYELLVPTGSTLWTVFHWILLAIGAVAFVGFIIIAVYGYLNNRRLVGTLAIDHLPAS